MVKLIFLIIAAVFFALAALKVPGPLDWTNAGFCCVVISVLV
jgi:hypothetical protein